MYIYFFVCRTLQWIFIIFCLKVNDISSSKVSLEVWLIILFRGSASMHNLMQSSATDLIKILPLWSFQMFFFCLLSESKSCWFHSTVSSDSVCNIVALHCFTLKDFLCFNFTWSTYISVHGAIWLISSLEEYSPYSMKENTNITYVRVAMFTPVGLTFPLKAWFARSKVLLSAPLGIHSHTVWAAPTAKTPHWQHEPDFYL